MLNSALAKYNGLLGVTLYQTNWIICCIVAGGVYFNEFRGFSATQAVLFPVGTLLCFLGVYIIVTKPTKIDAAGAIDSLSTPMSNELLRLGSTRGFFALKFSISESRKIDTIQKHLSFGTVKIRKSFSSPARIEHSGGNPILVPPELKKFETIKK